MTPMQHDGTMECYEQEAPYQLPVRQGGGSEEKADGRGRTAGDIG